MISYVRGKHVETFHSVSLECLSGSRMVLQQIQNFLDSYSGRDKLMRLLFYSSKFIAGFTSSQMLAQKLNLVCDQISTCRTVLRLFDDIPMLCYTLSYGLGHKEQDKCMQFCGVAVNAFDQMYYPLEHIAWAADLKLLPVRSDTWWTLSSTCWALSLYFMMTKSLRHFSILQDAKQILKEEGQNVRLALKRISQIEAHALRTAARCFIDLIHAIHWLPSGILWAGKLKQWHIGILGVISSLINLYQS